MKINLFCMMFFCALLAASGTTWACDNDDGTVTVNGLVWLKNAGGGISHTNWNDAMTLVKRLESGQHCLRDNSKPGDWRLPTKEELIGIRSSLSMFTEVKPVYWSSSTDIRNKTSAWILYINQGVSRFVSKNDLHYVWPVRSVK